jgi:hypothetical protein
MKLGRYDRNTNYQDFVLLEQKKTKLKKLIKELMCDSKLCAE